MEFINLPLRSNICMRQKYSYVSLAGHGTIERQQRHWKCYTAHNHVLYYAASLTDTKTGNRQVAGFRSKTVWIYVLHIGYRIVQFPYGPPLELVKPCKATPISDQINSSCFVQNYRNWQWCLYINIYVCILYCIDFTVYLLCLIV